MKISFTTSPLFWLLEHKVKLDFPVHKTTANFMIGAHEILPRGHQKINALYPRIIITTGWDAPPPRAWVPVVLEQQRLYQRIFDDMTKDELLDVYELGLTDKIREAPVLAKWIASKDIPFTAPPDWEPYLWPFVMTLGITPYEFASAAPDVLSPYWKEVCYPLRLWSMGVPLGVTAKMLKTKVSDVKAMMIAGARQLVSDPYIILWARNADVPWHERDAFLSESGSSFSLRHDINIKKRTRKRVATGEEMVYGEETKKVRRLLVRDRFPLHTWRRQHFLDLFSVSAVLRKRTSSKPD